MATQNTAPKMPTAAELAAARSASKAAEAQSTATGVDLAKRVHGLDYSQYAPAILDLNEQPGRVAEERIRFARKGYVKLEGDWIVLGYQKPEVWVKSRADYEADRQAKAQKIRLAVKNGMMHTSAVSVERIDTSDTAIRAGL